MEFVLKRPRELFDLDLERLGSFEPHDLVEMILAGLTEGICRIVPGQVDLPEEVCRELAGRWEDPEFQSDLRAAIEAAVAAALREKLPGALADPIAAYLTEKVLYPSLKAAGDVLLQRFCQSRT